MLRRLTITLLTRDFYLLSWLHSYRKIPGDKCEGGEMPVRKEIDLSKRCVSDLVSPDLLVSISLLRFIDNVTNVFISVSIMPSSGLLFLYR